MRQSVAAVQPAGTQTGTVADTVAGTVAGTVDDTVVVHVQLRPRRGSSRRCLAELAALAAAHPTVGFGVTGLGKDERVVRVTVGVELGPREAIARFSPQAQAAYAFVSDLFTVLYDHMPVYAAEPGPAERAAAEALLGAGDPEVVCVPEPRRPQPGERVPA